MKKVVSAGLLMLVVSMVFSGMPISADAQTDLSILLKIASQAQREIKQQISSSSSEEIKQLFREASDQVVLLEKSLDDPSSAKEHFLNAMKMFKKITQMISSDSPTQELQSADVASSSTRDYANVLKRIHKFITSLKSIERSESVSFEEVDRLFAKAQTLINDPNRENDREIKATLKQLKDVLDDIQRELRQYASKATDNKTITFFKTMLDRLEDRKADPESLKNARDMLSDYEQQIADGNYDKAKKLKNELTQLIREIYNATS